MRVFAIAAAMLLCVWSADTRADNYGPYPCGACDLRPNGPIQGSPTNQAVIDFLRDIRNGTYFIANGHVPVEIEVGDLVAVCDPEWCVAYEYNGMQGGFQAIDYGPNVVGYGAGLGFGVVGGPLGGGGGAGGGPTGGGGSGSTGGGGWGWAGGSGGGCVRCIGTVVVRPLRSY